MAARTRRGNARGKHRHNGESKVIRYAVVGLGYISQSAVLPAFRNARRNSRLAALVSDDARKLKLLGKRYGVEILHGYDTYDDLLGSGEIDAVYIALPNSMHREYVIRAANAGVHVLCEKPLAHTPEDCEEMIEACTRHRVQLMTAYRRHFERANLEMADIAHSGKLGELRYFSSNFSQQIAAGNVRLKG
jgi:glucose-fructose oxidoreductase